VGAAEVEAGEEADARGVDGGVAVEGWGLAETVVGLAEGDAGAAAGDEAWEVVLVGVWRGRWGLRI
jgi:hypothetical protein